MTHIIHKDLSMKNIQLKMVMLVVGILGLTFSSCMHAVMMGSHDSHEGMESITVTKEISRDDYTLTVTMPPMETRIEKTIAITLKSKSGIPDSVTIHYIITKSVMDGASSDHEHSIKDDSEEFKPIHQSISIINGAASIAYDPTKPGRFTLSVETTVNSVDLSNELSFMVHENKGHGMMGMGADWDYPIIGVFAMGAMMVTMWAIRGGF
ncbi:MAG: hypothetical protein ACYC09_13675 [Bacteroidota bacterium]